MIPLMTLNVTFGWLKHSCDNVISVFLMRNCNNDLDSTEILDYLIHIRKKRRARSRHSVFVFICFLARIGNKIINRWVTVLKQKPYKGGSPYESNIIYEVCAKHLLSYTNLQVPIISFTVHLMFFWSSKLLLCYWICLSILFMCI